MRTHFAFAHMLQGCLILHKGVIPVNVSCAQTAYRRTYSAAANLHDAIDVQQQQQQQQHGTAGDDRPSMQLCGQ